MINRLKIDLQTYDEEIKRQMQTIEDYQKQVALQVKRREEVLVKIYTMEHPLPEGIELGDGVSLAHFEDNQTKYEMGVISAEVYGNDSACYLIRQNDTVSPFVVKSYNIPFISPMKGAKKHRSKLSNEEKCVVITEGSFQRKVSG